MIIHSVPVGCAKTAKQTTQIRLFQSNAGPETVTSNPG
jgi:hypothetical protein